MSRNLLPLYQERTSPELFREREARIEQLAAYYAQPSERAQWDSDTATEIRSRYTLGAAPFHCGEFTAGMKPPEDLHESGPTAGEQPAVGPDQIKA